ncbi:MAG: hypothetical protein M2R46_05272 [Verrucomicrobia subdivision 3 bacterium]|nr:hypothetical protein [Limisphaerales bacterium]
MADDGNLDAWEGLWCQAKAGLESNTAYFKSHQDRRRRHKRRNAREKNW